MSVEPHNDRITRPARGFSLIEVMVAVAILAVIIVGLLAMFYQTQRAFRTGLTQVDVLENGRAAMEMIVSDLRDVTASPDNPTLNVLIDLPNGYSGLQPLTLPANESRSVYLQDLGLLRRYNDDWTGELLRVGNADLGVGTLYRLVTNNVYPSLVSDYIAGPVARNFPLDPTLNFTRVIDGVVHFQILPFDSSGMLIVSNSPSLPGVVVSGRKIQGNIIGTYSFTNNAIPAAVDIELGVLEPRALEQFRARTNNPAKAQAYLLGQAGRIHFFKQRVSLRNAGRYFAVTNAP
jgi:prepilin-type N-terminal cleavage/methylation domain-containing protein